MNTNQSTAESRKLDDSLTNISRRRFLTTSGAAATGVMIGGAAAAESPVTLKQWGGTIDFSSEGTSPFTLNGTASHLGLFTGRGEVEFRPGAEEGELVGNGVVVFTAANGDLLVGVVSWDAATEIDTLRTSHIHFSWRDSIKFRDGTNVASTGRFEKSRPPGLVVIAIIAVLIGLLLPAVQK